MIENFLRPPRGFSETAADVLRVFGAVSVLIAAAFFELTDAGVIAFALPGLVLPRFLGMVPWADITVTVTLMVAAWSNVFDLYATIAWWDLAVHFSCTGVVAAAAYLLLARLGIVIAPTSRGFTGAAGVVLTTTLGLALSAVWEMVEWVGHAFISDEIFVAYTDTIGDLAVGGLGALCAGFAVALLPLLRTSSAAYPEALCT